MEFSRLKASIANNAEEAPSIYMALCMVESLLDDIEDATGQEIGGWPVGDELLPTKMVWLCQAISQVYEEKGGELIRNRSRLDGAMGQLEEIRAEFEAFSETAQRLSAVKADLKREKAALERARADREEYERIQEQCRRLQLEADSLRGFDPAAEQAKLRGLQAETAGLAEERADLEGRLAALLADRDELVGKTVGLRVEIEQTQARVEQKSLALNGLEQQRQQARRRENELTEQLRQAMEELSALQDAVSQLEAERLPERSRQRDDEEARKNNLRQTLGALEDEIGRLLAENQELSVRIEKAKEDLSARDSTYSHLKEDYKQKNEEIAALDHRLEDLKGKTDAQKHEIYRRQMEEQIARLERIEAECADMERTLAALGQDIQTKQREAEELSREKARVEDMDREISDKLRRLELELEPLSSERFITRLEENRQRLEILEGVRGRLSATLSGIREILGAAPVDDGGAGLDRMKGTLQDLTHYMDQLQQNLVTYARSVKLEEIK